VGQDATLTTLNRVTQLVFSRHLLEFLSSGPSSPLSASSTGSLRLPEGLIAYTKAPGWGEHTYANTVGALVACIVVYDLFFYSFQCFIVGSRAGQRTGGRGLAWRTHPVHFAANSYFHLLAVAVVSMSPLGCHVAAVVAFLILSGIIDSMHARGTSLEAWILFTGHDSSQGYAKIGTFWDWACNTAA